MKGKKDKYFNPYTKKPLEAKGKHECGEVLPRWIKEAEEASKQTYPAATKEEVVVDEFEEATKRYKKSLSTSCGYTSQELLDSLIAEAEQALIKALENKTTENELLGYHREGYYSESE